MRIFSVIDQWLQEAMDLIEKLLVLDPAQRLGAGPSGWSAVKVRWRVFLSHLLFNSKYAAFTCCRRLICSGVGSDRPFKDPFSWRTPPEYLSRKFPFLFRTLNML